MEVFMQKESEGEKEHKRESLTSVVICLVYFSHHRIHLLTIEKEREAKIKKK